MLKQKPTKYSLSKPVRSLYLPITIILFLASCTQPPEPASVPTAVPATETAVSTLTIEPESTNQDSQLTTDNSPTPIPEADTATPMPTETAASPTATLETITLITATPLTTTPEAVAPPITSVTQPPYAASDCSDKYPCNEDEAAWEERIQVPEGFTDSYFARLEGHPTSITFGPDGRLYVALQEGTIYAINEAGTSSVYANSFNTPTGIAFQPGTSNLYVSSRVINENVGGEAQVSIANGRQILSGLPCCYTQLHAANGIAFGSDGFGYVAVGARADHGEILDGSNRQDERDPLEASILRFNPAGGEPEVYAHGLRNSYDIAWDANGDLYATDNAPDYGPLEEFHRVIPGGEHGYPWYDCGGCFSPPSGTEIVPPIYQFIPHSAPTGVTVYLANQFPGYYNSLFVTLWSAFPGAQKVVHFGPGGTNASDFAMGFADPVDVTVGPDGSLYVADWATGIIFKISYIE
jgi:glucose/arabinose dehydrogenase